MLYITYCATYLGMFLTKLRRKVFLLAAILACFAQFSQGQTPDTPQAPEAQTLANSLNRADTGDFQLLMIYVHGVGISAPKHSAGPQLEARFQKLMVKSGVEDRSLKK